MNRTKWLQRMITNCEFATETTLSLLCVWMANLYFMTAFMQLRTTRETSEHRVSHKENPSHEQLRDTWDMLPPFFTAHRTRARAPTHFLRKVFGLNDICPMVLAGDGEEKKLRAHENRLHQTLFFFFCADFFAAHAMWIRLRRFVPLGFLFWRKRQFIILPRARDAPGHSVTSTKMRRTQLPSTTIPIARQ